MPSAALFCRDVQVELSRDELLDRSQNVLRIGFAPDNADAEVISIPAVIEPSLSLVLSLHTRQLFTGAVELFDLQLDRGDFWRIWRIRFQPSNLFSARMDTVTVACVNPMMGSISAPMKSLLSSRHGRIEFMAGEICEDGGNHPSLRGAAIRTVVYPILKIAGWKPGFDEVDEPMVIDVLFPHADHHMVVDVVEETLNVHLDHPFDARPVVLNVFQRRMA
jgi:hypothetical protein